MFCIYIIFCLCFATAFAVSPKDMWKKLKLTVHKEPMSLSTLLLETFDNEKCYWRFPKEFVDKLLSTERYNPDDPLCAISEPKIYSPAELRDLRNKNYGLHQDAVQKVSPPSGEFAVLFLSISAIYGESAELYCVKPILQKIAKEMPRTPGSAKLNKYFNLKPNYGPEAKIGQDAVNDFKKQWKFGIDTTRKTIFLKHQNDNPKVLLDAVKVTNDFLRGSEETKTNPDIRAEFNSGGFRPFSPGAEYATLHKGSRVKMYYKDTKNLYEFSSATFVPWKYGK